MSTTRGYLLWTITWSGLYAAVLILVTDWPLVMVLCSACVCFAVMWATFFVKKRRERKAAP